MPKLKKIGLKLEVKQIFRLKLRLFRLYNNIDTI